MCVPFPVQEVLDQMIEAFRPVTDGEVATYIPELAKADPDLFGISIVTLSGHRYRSGDSGIPFTIQSISKPLAFGLALEDLGEEGVLERVGLEPTGDRFNAISLDAASGRPANPMINAGAIAVASMIAPGDGITSIDRLVAALSRYAGRPLVIDEDVYRSESETGHRNRAIAHLLRNSGIVLEDPEAGLDVYFRQCSISVTCDDLAAMAGCLANGGVNPITQERVLDPAYVEHVLAVMGTCGMYDYAGEWIYRVGIPAKSGVAGGVLAVLPGQLGIGVYSPRLDARGNSVRGVLVCENFSSRYGLHVLKAPSSSESAIRTVTDLTRSRSKRRRAPEADAALASHGSRALIYEIQGELNFAAAEAVTRNVVERASEVSVVAVDFRHTTRADSGAVSLVGELLSSLTSNGASVIFSDAEHTDRLRQMAESFAGQEPALRLANNKDQAIEWAEDCVLAEAGLLRPSEAVPLRLNRFFEGLAPGAVESLARAAVPHTALPGQPIVRRGDNARNIYLIVGGEASAHIEIGRNEHARVATYAAGSSFGESELVGDRLHDYDIVADTGLEYFEIALAALEILSESDPALAAALYRNIAGRCAAQLELANAEIQALSR